MGALTCSIPYPGAGKARVKQERKGYPMSDTIAQQGWRQDQVRPEEAELLA